jgi:hypothetical protein
MGAPHIQLLQMSICALEWLLWVGNRFWNRSTKTGRFLDFWTLGPQCEAIKEGFLHLRAFKASFWDASKSSTYPQKWTYYLGLDIGYPPKITWMVIISPMRLAILAVQRPFFQVPQPLNPPYIGRAGSLGDWNWRLMINRVCTSYNSRNNCSKLVRCLTYVEMFQSKTKYVPKDVSEKVPILSCLSLLCW